MVAVAVAVGVTYRQQIVTGLVWTLSAALFATGLAVCLGVLVALGWLFVSKNGKSTLDGWYEATSPVPQILVGFILFWVLWYHIVDAIEARRRRRAAIAEGRVPPP